MSWGEIDIFIKPIASVMLQFLFNDVLQYWGVTGIYVSSSNRVRWRTDVTRTGDKYDEVTFTWV